VKLEKSNRSALCYAIVITTLSILMARPAWALEKKGYTLNESGGYLYFGYFFHNPTFAARPDNTGLVLFRYGLHLDIQPVDWLTFSYDSNFFSDKEASNEIRPSEWDNHVALAAQWKAIEVSFQYERDAPADRDGLVQAYGELQVRLLWDLKFLAPTLTEQFPRQDLSGFFALGNFVYEENYFARPDNTGSVFLRYVGHVDLTLYRHGDWTYPAELDANFFTDRYSGSRLRPSELDLLVSLGTRWRALELSLIRETDMPMDRSGLTQSYDAVMLRWYFDFKKLKQPLS
jgi:hypothetical protein